ncbi:hypothetical protein B9Z19DRAFT_1094180 [Tuber borchii]|uniref:Uncharacterized protein n=1 Tax=Tuber borchii TaxID=42251 RepID=A0A2T6ZED4_TUBBO|nr:hypothetical protein B9Z19DRAFT_1094180 [Tuber borchii]
MRLSGQTSRSPFCSAFSHFFPPKPLSRPVPSSYLFAALPNWQGIQRLSTHIILVTVRRR